MVGVVRSGATVNVARIGAPSPAGTRDRRSTTWPFCSSRTSTGPIHVGSVWVKGLEAATNQGKPVLLFQLLGDFDDTYS